MAPQQHIGRIVVTPEKPKAGESFKVEVFTQTGEKWDDVNLSKLKINGMFGATHWFQAEDQDVFNIIVSNTSGTNCELKSVGVDVLTLSEEFFNKNEKELSQEEKKELRTLRKNLPILRLGKFTTNLNKVMLCLSPEPVFEMGRVDKLKDNAPILFNINAQWKIGKFRRNTAERAQIIHVFKNRSDDNDFHTHVVEVNVNRFEKRITVRRTLNIQNLYAFNKKRGYLIPEVIGGQNVSKIKTIKGKKWVETTVNIKNPGNETITFRGKKVRRYPGDQTSVLSNYLRIIKRRLGPGETKMLSFRTLKTMIGSGKRFTFYLFGTTASGLKVRLEVNSQIEETTTSAAQLTFTMKSKPPIIEGGICDPSNLPANVPDGFSCTATSEVNYEEVPGKFLNALKGDIVVIPGGNGLVGSLLRQVNPIQNYSHSGIMTRNFDEVTHNTASEDWLIDSQPGKTRPLDENALKFSWPGIIKQSVDATVHGEDLTSPEGKSYRLYGFPPTGESPEFQIYYPLVIKPDPLLETPEIRSKLIQMADLVRGLHNKGHYKWYCYTNPSVYNQPLPSMPANYWANDTTPGVCSSTIWMAARKLGFFLEGELEQEEVIDGVELEENTPDGLYLYTEAERRAAAEFLFLHIRNLARNQSNMSGLSRVSTKLAKQMINTFAADRSDSDKINKIYKDVMENISDAFAVSPDDLFNWDSPLTGGLYGYVTPLLYRDRRFEDVTVHRWEVQQPENFTTVTGMVKLNNGNAVSRCHVMLNSSLSAYTNTSGEFSIANVPFGNYQVTLRPDDDIAGYSGETRKNIGVSSSSNHFNLSLDERDVSNRRISVELDVDVFDYDGQRYRGHAQDFIHRILTVNSGQTKDTKTFTRSFTIRKSNGKLKGSNIKLEVSLVGHLLSSQTGSIRLDITAKLLESQKRNRIDVDDSFFRSYTIGDNQTNEYANLELDSNEIRDRDRISIDLLISNEREL